MVHKDFEELGEDGWIVDSYDDLRFVILMQFDQESEDYNSKTYSLVIIYWSEWIVWGILGKGYFKRFLSVMIKHFIISLLIYIKFNLISY